MLQAQGVTLTGRVQDRSTRGVIAGATVTLEGERVATTTTGGEFRFTDLATGMRVLRIEAIGYTRRTLRFELHADTTIDILLDVDPVRLDTLRVNTRFVNVSGRLTERQTKIPVMDGAVFASHKPQERTNRDGRFRFSKVPAGVPFQVHVVAFPYEPVLVTITPERDTTLHLELNTDTLMQRLIAEQSRRLEVRMVDAVGKGYSINREQLMKYREGNLGYSLAWVMKFAPYSRSKPKVCAFVDEQRSAVVDPENFLMPEEIERVELLFDGAMIRIYTRRFMANMVSRDVPLEKPGYSQPPGMGGRATSWASCG